MSLAMTFKILSRKRIKTSDKLHMLHNGEIKYNANQSSYIFLPGVVLPTTSTQHILYGHASLIPRRAIPDKHGPICATL